MKIFFKAIGLLLIVVIAVVLFRTFTVFTDQQPKPELASNGQKPQLDFQIDRDDALQRLSSAIQIRTISYDDRKRFDAPAFLRFHQHLRSAFPTVHQVAQKTVINQYSLIYHIAGSDPTLKPVLFLSHMDVVPIDDNTRNQWLHAPFSGDISGDISDDISDGSGSKTVWGRGTIDDKGGLMALMEATEALLKQGAQPKRSLYLSFGHDEEVGGNNGAAQVAQYFIDHKIHFEFVLDEGGAVTEGLVNGFSQPVALVGIAEKGYTNLHLKVASQGGHSSQPPAQTAVGILSQAIVNIEQNPFPASLQFSELTFDAIGSYAPFVTRMVMSNLWLFEPLVKKVLLSQPKLGASLHTTMAPTMLSGSPKSNVLPTLATGVINSRIFPGETYDSVKARAISIINDPRVSVELSTKTNPSPVSSIDSYGYKLIAQTIVQSDSNILVAPYLVQGGTDSKYFYPVSNNVYRFLMVRTSKEKLKRFHGINEQISADDYFAAIGFYYHLLSRVATGF